MPISSLLGLVLIGSCIVFIMAIVGAGFLVLQRLSAMRQTIVQLQTTSQEAQNATQQLRTSTEGYFQQIQTNQTSTQAAVTATRQETLRSVQDLHQLQHASQLLMNEIRTQQGTSQTFFTDWQNTSQALFAGWQKDTTELRRALQTTYQQGTWGEQELRRVVELAGMIPHCDFDVQQRLPNGQKPDMLIRLHDQQSIVLDAKAPSQAYLNAVRCEDDKARTILLKDYARRIRDMVLELSGREYWKQFQPSPALVVLFMPNEAMLRAAFEYDSGLYDLAAEKGVLLASPMILIALLKAIAHGWSQEDRAQNVLRIIDASRELHQELAAWLTQWQQVKKAIQKTSAEFDRTARTYQTRILPLITGLGQLDSTLLVKEKAFDLQPIRDFHLEETTLLELKEESDETEPPNENEEDDSGQASSG